MMGLTPNFRYTSAGSLESVAMEASYIEQDI